MPSPSSSTDRFTISLEPRPAVSLPTSPISGNSQRKSSKKLARQRSFTALHQLGTATLTKEVTRPKSGKNRNFLENSNSFS